MLKGNGKDKINKTNKLLQNLNLYSYQTVSLQQKFN